HLYINTNDTTLVAGDTGSLSAVLIDQRGNTITDKSITSKISWSIIEPHADDQIVGNSYGDNIRYTAKEAYRVISIVAEYSDNGNRIADTAKVTIVPGKAHHLVIEGSSTPRLYRDDPVNSITIGASQTRDTVYAVLRDRVGNFVELSKKTSWTPLPPLGIVNATVGRDSLGEGIISKIGPSGVTSVKATDLTNNFSDTLTVTVESITYDSLRIMVYDIGQGRLVRINSLTMQISDSTVLYVQGLRSDRIGPPGSGGWVDVSGIWSISNTSLVTPPPPSAAQNAWSIKAENRGTGTISVRMAGGPQTSIPITVNPGSPNKLVLYPVSGNPGNSAPHPSISLTADTLTAGVAYTKLYAKLFDLKNNWLSDYETMPVHSQEITWKVIPANETSFASPTGASNRITSTMAHRELLVIASMNNLADTIKVWVKPGPATHLVIEETADITNHLTDDNPLQLLVIRSDMELAYVYAILRDAYGNFVRYSNPTKWQSTDTNTVYTDTALTAIGEGYVLRKTDAGNASVIAIDLATNFRDTVPVEVQNIYYKNLRIYLINNGKQYIDSIRVRVDSSVTLYAEGERSDNGAYENVNVTWKVRGTLPTTTPPPISSDRWVITPDSMGQGLISISLQDALPDSVFATFTEGLPGKMAIYKELGNPNTMRPYTTPPNIDTIEAGVTAPLVAKIFDRNNNWLRTYENIAVSTPLISWSISRVSGPGTADTLATRKGHITSFSPTRAYNTYLITAQFSDGVRNLTAQVQIYVKPSVAHHLVIEGTSNITGSALVSDQPLDVIEFGAKDTVKTAFAILRDRFGNFVSHSTSTNWFTLDSLIAKAKEGTALVGEGKVTRIDSLGRTKGVAVNRQNSTLRDTVEIVLSKFSIDSLRIVVLDSIKISSLTMRSDEDTILQVQGKRSFDGMWVPVSGNWYYTTTNGEALTMPSTHAWDFAPGDTGTGQITVSLGNAVPASITVKITAGLPAKLVLYPKEGSPSASNTPYIDPLKSIEAIAGTPFPLVAKIFDHKNVWLAQYELPPDNKKIHWTKIEIPGSDSTGKLDDTTGHKRSFTPVRAYQTVYIVADLVTTGNLVLKDTVLLEVKPGQIRQLVIEGSPNWESSKNKANPIPVIEITDNMTSAKGYAVLRDSIGNFVKFSNPTTWGIVNNDTIITVRNGLADIGEGVIQRILREGNAKVYAIDNTLGYKDTVDVKLLPYYYTELRIMSNNTRIEYLEMNTNLDTTLYVEGLRSDSLIWVRIPARWDNSSNLKIVPSAPGWENTWTFSPSDTGTGQIRVSLENGLVTIPDTIDVNFTVGPPTNIDIKIITPPEQRIVDKPIVFEVTITNKDGLVPGTYCIPNVQYVDVLGDGGKVSKPFILVGSDTLWLSLKDSTKQCFNGGKSTVTGYFYHAPFEGKEKHAVTVSTGGGLTATSEPFILLPGKLDSLVIERQNGTAIKDVVLNYPDGQIVMLAVGYDAWGNKIGNIESNWTTDSTLHPIDKPNNTSRIYYDASSVTDNEAGKIKATPVDAASKNITAQVPVKIIGIPITLTAAITRDLNGNGYLDHIELHFSKDVDLTKEFISQLQIFNNDYSFSIDSVTRVGKGDTSYWMVFLHENQISEPQTGWKPTITGPGLEDIGLVRIDQ
ncbi:MAG: hypothetical protein GX640_23950, partial [Fibrobacter sp.]|nr:hypothetical protein [Fibrobacter sp.]